MTTVSTKSEKVIKVVSREAMQVGAEYAAEVLSHYGGF